MNDGRRPVPPVGFVRMKKKDHCPVCKKKMGHEVGAVFKGSGWQDEDVQAAMDAYQAELDAWRTEVAANPTDHPPMPERPQNVFGHWSRYGLGRMLCCNVELWHDFGAEDNPLSTEWLYYYQPKNQGVLPGLDLGDQKPMKQEPLL